MQIWEKAADSPSSVMFMRHDAGFLRVYFRGADYKPILMGSWRMPERNPAVETAMIALALAAAKQFETAEWNRWA